jgi:uncharacterized protein (TIGR03663 family)
MTIGENVKPAIDWGDQETTRPAALTMEVVWYAAIGVLAALVRLWTLDAWPLRVEEAMQALGAWNLVGGDAVGVSDYSPILMTGNLIFFGLFQASDAVARLWPAIFGISLALAPALLRDRLGRVGALAASLLLALSPTILFASRALDGRVVAIEAGLLLLIAVVRVLDSGDRRYLVLGAAALACGLLSAPIFYTILALLISGGLVMWALRRWLVFGLDERVVSETWQEWRHEPALWIRLGVICAAVLLVLGAGFFFNLDGLGAAADMLPAWLQWFSWGAASLPPAMTLWGLALYETLALLFGVAGLAVGWIRRDAFSLLLGWWAMIGLGLSLAAGGWQPADLALLALPLALLAGKLLGELFETLSAEPLIDGEWLILALSPILGTFAYFSFAQYSRNGTPLTIITAVIIVPAIFLLVSGLMSASMGWRRGLRSVGLVVALCGLLLMVSAAWKSNHSSDPARYDLLSMDRIEPGVRDLTIIANRYSAQQMKGASVAPTLVVGESLRWLQWELREFRNVTYVNLFDELAGHRLVLSPAGVEPPLGESYSGQDIFVSSSWRPTGLTGQNLVKWLILRKPPQTMTRESVILWAPRPAQDM